MGLGYCRAQSACCSCCSWRSHWDLSAGLENGANEARTTDSIQVWACYLFTEQSFVLWPRFALASACHSPNGPEEQSGESINEWGIHFHYKKIKHKTSWTQIYSKTFIGVGQWVVIGGRHTSQNMKLNKSICYGQRPKEAQFLMPMLSRRKTKNLIKHVFTKSLT
jgi:hypothetical protein